jgi:hypothetical protein
MHVLFHDVESPFSGSLLAFIFGIIASMVLVAYLGTEPILFLCSHDTLMFRLNLDKTGC